MRVKAAAYIHSVKAAARVNARQGSCMWKQQHAYMSVKAIKYAEHTQADKQNDSISATKGNKAPGWSYHFMERETSIIQTASARAVCNKIQSRGASALSRARQTNINAFGSDILSGNWTSVPRLMSELLLQHNIAIALYIWHFTGPAALEQSLYLLFRLEKAWIYSVGYG